MKKNISKIIVIGIGLSVIYGSIVPSFATENVGNNQSISLSISADKSDSIILGATTKNTQSLSAKPIITLDKVITAAIENSGKVALKSKQIKMYRDEIKLQNAKDDYFETINEKVYDFPYDKLDLLKKQTNQSEEFLQDQITNDITNKYNAVILKQMEINKLKTNLEIKTKDLENMKAKISIGMITNNQLYDKQIEVKSLQDDIKSKEGSLQNNLDYLEVLTKLNLSEHTLDSSTNYEVFRIDGSVDEYIDDKIDIYLKYEDKIIELTRDYFDELEDDGIKDIPDEDKVPMPDKYSASFNTTNETTGENVFDSSKYALALIAYEKKLTNYQSYLEGNYSIDAAKVKLDDSRKNLRNILKENYSTLLDLENKIDRLNEQIKSTNEKLRYAKSKADMGMITKSDYKSQVVKSYDLDISLRNLINTYNNLKNNIQEPWILSNN